MGQVADVIEASYLDALSREEQLAKGAILRTGKGKALAARGQVEQMGDDAAVDKSGDHGVRMGPVETSEGTAEARVESLRAFPTRDNIPALLALHLEIDRIELCHLPAEEPTFPSPRCTS